MLRTHIFSSAFGAILSLCIICSYTPAAFAAEDAPSSVPTAPPDAPPVDATLTTIATDQDILALEQKIDQLRQDISTLQADNKRRDQRIETMARQELFLMNLASRKFAQISPREKTPNKPFEYYTSDEWIARRDRYTHNIQTLLQKSWPTFDGGKGVDTMDLSDNGPGDFLIDGIYFRSLEVFKLNNNAANTMVINAPGLADIEDNKLYILGDPGLDKVLLDGCLKWKNAGKDKDVTKWIAMDIKGKKRQVSINNGVETKILPECNNDYFGQQDIMALQHLWLNDIPLEHIKEPEHFGGLGISIKSQPEGILILATLPDLPAFKAGLRPGDYIVKIGDDSTKGMNVEKAASLMRGPVGTEVNITYISSTDPAKTPYTVKIKRAEVNAKDIVR